MKVGLVGTGLMGRTHAPGWQQREGVLTAVYGRSNASRFAREFGLTPCATYADLLERVDIVDLCTPTPSHAEYALQAARAGKHIICEKPLALTLNEADKVIQAVSDAGVRLFVAHVLRFFPQYRAAWEQVQAGAIGTPTVLRLSRVTSPPTAGSWLLDETQSGGVALDLLIHDLDFARWVVGEVQSVYAQETRRSGKVLVQATLNHRNGAVSLVEGGWAAPPGVFRTSLDLAGTEGVIEWNSDLLAPLRTLGSPPTLPAQEGAALPALSADNPYAVELWHAYDAIQNKQPFLIEADEARRSLMLALAVQHSLQTGKVAQVSA